MYAAVDFTPLVLGILLLLLGGRLVWFFIAALGFTLGMEYGIAVFPSVSEPVLFFLSVCLGIGTAVAAMFVSRVALLGAGFICGGYLVLHFWGMRLGEAPWFFWLVLAGGAAGALAMGAAVKGALIVLSSLLGAALVAGASGVREGLGGIVFVCLFAVGVWVQTFGRRQRTKRDDAGKSG